MALTRQGFISYSHDDYPHYVQIARLMKQIERNYAFSFWSDSRIAPGNHWSAEIENNIKKSSAFILIVSNSFFVSDYIFDKELPAIKETHKSSGAIMLPIVLEPCSWAAFVGTFQAIPIGKGEQSGRLLPVLEWQPEKYGFNATREQVESALCQWFGLAPVHNW